MVKNNRKSLLNKYGQVRIDVAKHTGKPEPNENERKDMRKIIAGINMTIDGFCDQTLLLPDEEIHQHYTEQLRGADAILFGRITYELIQYWQIR